MRKVLTLVALCGCFLSVACRGEDILVVADEFHAMQVLTSHIQSDTKLTSRIIGQTELPPSLSSYRAVIVYIHGDLQAASEHAFIKYAEDGGKLILLHHSISSHKRENKDWFSFLHIALPLGDLAAGGYKYFAPVSFDIVNLAPGNYVTSHNVHFDKMIPYTDPAGGGEHTLPGTGFTDTEVYLNHKLSGPRTLLLGIKYCHPATGVVYMQDTAGWIMESGKGMVFYFMAGHRAEDFDNLAYSQILSNAVEYRKLIQGIFLLLQSTPLHGARLVCNCEWNKNGLRKNSHLLQTVASLNWRPLPACGVDVPKSAYCCYLHDS